MKKLIIIVAVVILAGAAYAYRDGYLRRAGRISCPAGETRDAAADTCVPLLKQEQTPRPITGKPEESTLSVYKDLVQVDDLKAGDSVSSPLTIRGKARGMWFFEGTFTVVITDWDGKIIGQSYAESQGEWMTTDYVPFVSTIEFTVPADAPYRRGTVILRKENPSDMREHDDAFEIPVVFR